MSLDGDTAGGTWEVSLDTDSDGVPDEKDPFPNDSTEWKDTDGDGIGDNVDPDAENDGMPDEWEERYGLNPLVNDALDDLDGDTVSNLVEYEEGTDPDNLPVEAFVIRFYQLCLNRNADGAGLNGWVDGLLDGSFTGSDVAYGFVFSPEFLEKNITNEEYPMSLRCMLTPSRSEPVLDKADPGGTFHNEVRVNDILVTRWDQYVSSDHFQL